MTILKTRDLAVGYAARGIQRPILRGLNLQLQAGEFVCLLGQNGTGKSTLLRTLTRAQKPLAGAVLIDDQPLQQMTQTDLARCLSVVLTERVEVGNLSVYDLVSLGRYPYTGWGGQLTPRDHEVVGWALSVTGNEPLAGRSVAELSDGERQRVMIARALAQEPRVMLLDEPTAFLDAPRRAELTGLLRRLAHDTGLAVLLSTHDVELALRTADTIWLITPDGRLLTALPEEMILGGVFAAAFDHPDYAFDALSGGFRMRQPGAQTVALRGEGVVALTTRRLLERHGYQVVERDPADLSLACQPTHNGYRWELTIAGETGSYESLADLSRVLAQHNAQAQRMGGFSMMS